MGNCLVTKLKEVVNNDNLEKLGIIEILVRNTSGEKQTITRLGGLESSPVHVKITDGTLYRYGDTTNLGEEADFIGDTAIQYVANNDCKIIICKYNLAYIRCFALNDDGTFNSDKYNSFKFKISTFGTCSTLKKFYVSPASGDILDIANCLEIEEIGVQKQSQIDYGFRGDVVEFVKAQIAKGRTPNYTLTIDGSSFRFTFNGFIMWGTNMIGTIVHAVSADKIWAEGTGAGSNLVFTYGYTNEEIAENTASGGIWEGKTVANRG